MKGKYELVLDVIESYEMKDVLNDFKSEFKVGEDISKEDYMLFCKKYIDDMSEIDNIKLNWKWIISGGDDSVYDEIF